MAGSNPYIQEAEVKLPAKSFKITFLPENKQLDVDPAMIPYSREGLEGSLLNYAIGIGVDIDHACGGVCACSTCHVVVREGLDSCNEGTEDEEDQLDNAPGLTPQSRLACQCVPDGTKDLVVEIPEWNRNAAKEDE